MIFVKLTQQLNLLSDLLLKLNPQSYTTPIKHLGNASIGGHTRHILELLKCAIDGYAEGLIDYENRQRDLFLETNLNSAQAQLKFLLLQIEKTDKPLKIFQNQGFSESVSTTYYREILYNTEHSIHHLALIKVALIDMDLNLVDTEFGMAYSTIQYQKQLSSQ